VRGRTIGLWGLSFKPETDDLRDAPSLDIIAALTSMGAYIKVYDPVAMDNCRLHYPQVDIVYECNAIELARGCDAVVLVTEWDEFRRLQLDTVAAVMSGEKVLIDARNVFSQVEAVEAGLTYVGFGR